MNNSEQNSFSGSAVKKVGKILMAGLLCLAMVFSVSVVSAPDAAAACYSKTSCSGKICNNSSNNGYKVNQWFFGNNCGFGSASNGGFRIDANGNLCFNGFCFGKVDVSDCRGGNCQNNDNNDSEPQQPENPPVDDNNVGDDNNNDNNNNNDSNIDNDNSGDNANDNVNDNISEENPGSNQGGNQDNEQNNSQSGAVSQFEREVVSLCNEIRASYGLSPLTINEKLCRLARMKSQDMVDKNYFSHESPTYGSPFDMLKSYGVSYRSAGENIAKGYATPKAVVDAWMNSEGHRANILNSSYAEIGVGYVTDGNHWTQLFLKQ